MFQQKIFPYKVQQSHEARLQQGLTLHRQGRLDAAKAIYEGILREDPNHSDSLHFLGVIEDYRGNFQRAVELIEKSISINPTNPSCYLNLGNAQLHMRQTDSALTNYAKAIKLKPDYAAAYVSRGAALEMGGQFEDAIKCYDTAIAFNKDFAQAYWNKASLLLLTGNLELGWKLYEYRWLVHAHGLVARSFPQPLWLGIESLQGKSILLYDEQGLGDSIQFARYVACVADQGARVILEIAKPLYTIFQSLSGVQELISKGAPLPAFDFHCPLASLPLAFKTTFDTIPNKHPYLQSSAKKKAEWANRLGDKKRNRVGLIWSGNKDHVNDLNRSITLSALARHLPDGPEYYSLQKELRAHDRLTLSELSNIRHFEVELQDFEDTAALCELMDIVISVDTSVAHLSGALGKTTWILIPYLPDWRWLLNRADSPWYPSASLIRQTRPGDWSAPLETVQKRLEAWESAIL